MKSTVIIDYGYGNLFSLKNALARCGARVRLSSTPEEMEDAEALFLPGVGAFGKGIAELRKRGLEKPIKKHVAEGKPLFGICLGMQFLFGRSEEFGTHEGLGLIDGNVERMILEEDSACKIPHVGWNKLTLPEHRASWDRTIFEGVGKNAQVYFIHSYVGTTRRKEDILSETDYCGTRMVSSVLKGNIVGTQFHPEKSGEVGLRILKNFIQSI